MLMSMGSAIDGSEQTLSDTHTCLSWKGLPTIDSAVLSRMEPLFSWQFRNEFWKSGVRPWFSLFRRTA